MANSLEDVIRIFDTHANVSSALREKQVGWSTDAPYRMVANYVGGTKRNWTSDDSDMTRSGNIIMGASNRIDTPIIRAASSAGLRLEEDGGSLGAFIEDSTGHVGLNTTSPTGRLHMVENNATVDMNMDRVDTEVALDDIIARFNFRGGESATATVSQIRVQAENAWTASDSATRMVFGTTSASATATSDKMALDKAGQLGIGVITSIGADLHIQRSTSATALIENTGDASVGLTLDADRGAEGNTLGAVDFAWNGTASARISALAGADTSNKDEADLSLAVGDEGSLSTRLLITSEGNVSLFTGTESYGSGTLVAFIANATTAPTTNPSGGGILYAEGGALKWRGSGGTTTTLGAA